MNTMKVVTVARSAGIDENTTATTPGTLPNVEVYAMPVWQAIGVRVLRAYLMALVGLLSARMTGLDQGVLVGDFLSVFALCASMSVGAGVMSLLTNGLEILTKLDVTNPGLRA